MCIDRRRCRMDRIGEGAATHAVEVARPSRLRKHRRLEACTTDLGTGARVDTPNAPPPEEIKIVEDA